MNNALRIRPRFSFALMTVAASLLYPPALHAADAGEAQTLARQNKCFTCHAVDTKKTGPAWKDVAAKYKGKSDAEATLIKHLTSGPKMKYPDGTEGDHPILKSKTPEDTKNLADWILSL